MQRRYYLSVVVGGLAAGCSSSESTEAPTAPSTLPSQSGYGGTPTVSATPSPNSTQTRTSPPTTTLDSTPTAESTLTDTTTTPPLESDEYGDVSYGEGGYGGTR